jgi:hypothetical protein
MEEYKSCKDAGSLSCGSGMAFDNSAECSACADSFTLTKNLKCAKMCYSCGDVSDGTYVEKDQCNIPADGANATETDAKLVPCYSGICYAVTQGSKVASGCLPETLSSCTGDFALGEACRTAGGVTLCEQCCSSEKCNSFVQSLDGIPDSATNMAVSVLLISAAALLAMF